MVGEAVGELEHEVMLVESIEDLKDVVKMIAKAVDDGRFDAEPDDELTGMLDQMDLRISAIEKRLDNDLWRVHLPSRKHLS